MAQKEFALEREVEALKNERATHLRTIAELNETIRELSCELKQCVSPEKFQSIESRLSEQCQRYVNVVSMSETYAAMYRSKNEECESLLKELKAKDEVIAANKESIKCMFEKYSTMEQELAKAKRELSDVAEQRKSLLKEIESLRSTMTKKSDDDVNVSISEKMVVEDEIKSINVQIEQCNTSISELQTSTINCDVKIKEKMEVDTPTIGKPVLSFRSKRIQFGTPDENESPTTFTLSFKRPQPMQRTAIQSKRNRSLFPKNMNIMNSNPEVELNIMRAVQKADQDANLIGDFSKKYALPLIANSKHQDLKAISSETLASVINGEFKEIVFSYKIIDCRYPYEFEGGHIQGAENIYTQEQILEAFFDEKTRLEHKVAESHGKRNVVIFHCEFSSERGPSLYRYLRSKDREFNTYPNLYHPEVYLLNGGYKAFFETFKELCEPQQYLPMLSKDHRQQMRQFRKSKSWNCENKNAGNCSNSNSNTKPPPQQ